MPETIGTLNLKIIRLRHYLRLLEQKQQMSSTYPVLQARLAQEALQIQFQLIQLTEQREQLLIEQNNIINERTYYGDFEGQRTIYTTH